ncbi:MAG: DUF4340 domain-containing protein [Acidobacteriota bacterium]
MVVVGLGAFIYFVERHAPTTEEKKERQDKVFPNLEQDQITAMTIEGPAGRFVLAKQNGEWRLEQPLADAADESAVSSVLASLANLRAERTLPLAEVKLEDYGLAPPPLSVTLMDSKGGTFNLKLGAELPFGTTRAALTNGEAVLLVSKWVGSDLERDLSRWRSSELARLLSSEVASLSLRAPEGQVVLARGAGMWTITEPIQDLADRERVEGLVGDLNAARIREFLDTAPDLAALGLDPPRLTLTVVRRDDRPPLQLAFGAERDQDGSKQVACRRGERAFWVDATAVARLSANLAQWRSPKLVALQPWAAESLKISHGGESAELRRVEGVWKAGGAEVDYGAVSRRLTILSELQVVAFDRPLPTGEPVGSVEVKTNDGAEVDVKFFAGAGPGENLAVVAGRSGALAVDGARVAELLEDPAALTRPAPTPAPLDTPTS